MPVSKGHIKGRFQKGYVPVPNSVTGKPGKVPGTKSAVSGRFLQDLAEQHPSAEARSRAAHVSARRVDGHVMTQPPRCIINTKLDNL